jgi:hypothetical protein
VLRRQPALDSEADRIAESIFERAAGLLEWQTCHFVDKIFSKGVLRGGVIIWVDGSRRRRARRTILPCWYREKRKPSCGKLYFRAGASK